MASKCVECSENDRQNNGKMVPFLTPITYENSDVIMNFCLPRKYTSSHNDEKKEVYISVGNNYNKFLLESEETVKTESQVIGKWIKRGDKYRINLKVLVSTEKNPLALIRNKIFCQELGIVLQGIALAETSLLKTHPHLLKTKIFIHFKSIDPKYDRIEYWGRLSRWCS